MSRSVLSDAPCFEEITIYTGGPLRGQPCALGRPLDGAISAIILLSDGTITSWTILDGEQAELKSRLGFCWKRILLAAEIEIGMAKSGHAKLRHDLLRLAGLAPLAILCYRSWRDLNLESGNGKTS